MNASPHELFLLSTDRQHCFSYQTEMPFSVGCKRSGVGATFRMSYPWEPLRFTGYALGQVAVGAAFGISSKLLEAANSRDASVAVLVALVALQIADQAELVYLPWNYHLCRDGDDKKGDSAEDGSPSPIVLFAQRNLFLALGFALGFGFDELKKSLTFDVGFRRRFNVNL